MSETTASAESEASTNEDALRTEHLSKHFGDVVAVDDVDFTLPRGEIRSIIGPNGAGKTTFFNTIMGRLSPTEGKIILDGDDITDESEEYRPHAGIARSFQSNELFVELSVFENIRVIAQHAQTGSSKLDLFRTGRDVAADRAEEILTSIGLDHIRDDVAKNLSHGDQRRLGIALALATDPDILLLDEPTSGMSQGESIETTEVIEQIHDEYDLTLIVIEHDMDVVRSLSDRITVLHEGSILTTGTPEEVQDNEAVQEAYLGGATEEEL